MTTPYPKGRGPTCFSAQIKIFHAGPSQIYWYLTFTSIRAADGKMTFLCTCVHLIYFLLSHFWKMITHPIHTNGDQCPGKKMFGT